MNFDEWLNYIHSLPYFERRVKISRNIEPPPSRFLYKYKSVDETNPTTTDRLRDILVRSRLWLSSPIDFNDPFDMSAKIIAGATPDERLERYKAFIEGKGFRLKKENE